LQQSVILGLLFRWRYKAAAKRGFNLLIPTREHGDLIIWF